MVYPITKISHKSAAEVDPGIAIADPLKHLVACHDRILDRLAILERIIPSLADKNQGTRAEARQVLDRALQFLYDMGALHTEDEEDSLFPRLMTKNKAGNAEAVELTTLLEVQHREKEEVLKKLQNLARLLPDASAMPSSELVGGIEATAAHLSSLYQPHIMIENERLIPLSADMLSKEELEAMRQEMLQRRAGK